MISFDGFAELNKNFYVLHNGYVARNFNQKWRCRTSLSVSLDIIPLAGSTVNLSQFLSLLLFQG